MNLLCLVILVSSLSFVHVVLQEEVVESVARRFSGDSYTLSNTTGQRICHDDGNLTLLVDERRCIKNEELFNGCSFAIATHEEGLSNRRLALSFAPQNDTDMTTAATFFNSSGAPKLTDTVVVHKEQPVSTVNTSFCCISTLEVYRGKQQAIKIKHNGFSLSHSGTIVINRATLAYREEDYNGELYRMNLSCSGGELPESGCLYFKVVAGVTNILEAKFNSTVSGTLVTESDDKTSVMITSIPWTAPSTTLTTIPSIESDSMTPTTVTLTRETGSKSIIEVGSTLFYIVIGAGSAVLILSLIITIMLTAICFLATKKGQSYTLAIDDKDGDRARDSPNLDWPQQVQGTTEALMESASQSEPIHFNLGPRHDSVAEIATEHLYAEIREHDTSSPSPPPLPPPLMTDELIEEGSTTAESNYQANVSIPSHLKWPSKRASRTAELAYLYEGHDAAFHELPFYPKRAGVTDAIDPTTALYDDPTSLSLVPARGIKGKGWLPESYTPTKTRFNGGAETEVRPS